jgi:hypothetical protein
MTPDKAAVAILAIKSVSIWRDRGFNRENSLDRFCDFFARDGANTQIGFLAVR